MIKESNTMTFTKRLNYSVTEVTREEFLAALSQYGKAEKNKHHAEKIESEFLKVER